MTSITDFLSGEDTRLASWRQLQKTLAEKQQKVYTVIADREELGVDTTLFEVAETLGVPAHYVSGRFTELKKKSLIVKSSKRVNPDSGKACWAYTTTKRSKIIGEYKE